MLIMPRPIFLIFAWLITIGGIGTMIIGKMGKYPDLTFPMTPFHARAAGFLAFCMGIALLWTLRKKS